MQSHYPVVLIPDALQNAAQAKLDQPPHYPVPPPVLPTEQPEPLKAQKIATHTAIAALPSVVTHAEPKARPVGIGFTLVLLLLLAIKTMRQWLAGKQHRQQVEQYHLDMPLYQEEKRKHEAAALSAFHSKLILQILRQTQGPDGSNSRAARGISEADFEEILHQYFPGKIQTKHTLKIPNFRYPYSPDFSYVDAEHNLFIDIEVDEPYRLKDYEPTHYLKSRKETRRNHFFLNKGWLVIRFSEEQVVCWPEQCCKTIASVVAQLLGNEMDAQFDAIPDLPLQARWTEQEAIAFAAQSIRDSYRVS